MNQVLATILTIPCASGYLIATSAITFAQVSSDGTVNTQVDQNGNVSEITGGETRGSNLFHSFQDFSVPSGNEAFFDNAQSISNIFSRVTGGGISNIDGAIRANGSANLFLINPAGIVFGENARLDIGGSFYGSTASSILFEDGEFSAADLENPPLLTVNAPIGLGFRDEPGDIINRSNFGLSTKVLDENFSDQFAEESFTTSKSVGLEVNPQQTLALIGGDVILENIAGITAPEGIVELGGLSQAGTINFSNNGGLIYPDDVAKSDVSLSNSSQIEVRGDSEGTVNINAKNLVLSEQSKIFAGIAEGGRAENAQGGDITINATDSVQLIGDEVSPPGLGTEINNHVGTAPNRRDSPDIASNALGNGGAVIINTNRLEISNQARITANSYAQGDAGDIILNTNSIMMDGGAIASLIIEGRGNAGNITINNSDDIVLNQGSNIQSQVLRGGVGDVGNITIDTKTFAINERFSFVLADNVSAGNAGDVTINARDSVFIDGGGGENLGETLSAILSQVQTNVTGNAGDIRITTSQLSLTNFALISTNVREGSIGNTGNIFLKVDSLSLNNGAVIDALTENEFDGGNINIDAGTINLSNGGKIITSGDRGGNAGNINLDVENNLVIRNDNPPAITPFLEPILQDSAREAGLFSSTVAGEGNGGSISIEAQSIELESNASISVSTFSGQGGNLLLNAEEIIILKNDSVISAEANTLGNGGNINIDANFILAFPDGSNDIIANAQQGNGGNIEIQARSLLGIRERSQNDLTNDIDASSDFNLDGTVNINLLSFDPIQGITELPQNVVEPQETTAQACEADRSIAANNRLTVKGKGGIIADPAQPLSSTGIMIDGEVEESTAYIPAPIETAQGKIQPARGIKITKSGKVILTAYRTDNAGNRIPEIPSSCGVRSDI